MLEPDRLELQARYRARFAQFGFDSRSLGWMKDCQWVRFEAAFEALRESDFDSVLDFGCGFGDALGYLREKGWRGKYRGIDAVEELVSEARKQYAGDPDAEFIHGDLEDAALPSKAAMSLALGLFNHRLHEDNSEFIRRTMRRMWDCTTRVTVCDFLSTSSDPDRRQPDLYYADPAEIYRIASQFSKRVALHHAYMPFEFQIKIWRDDSFEQSAPVFAPYRSLSSSQSEWRLRRK